ncbi:hypothetical protein BH09BAC1_BH09BAC1_10970 [soil metagenome]
MSNKQQKINLHLTIEDVSLIFKGLGKLPFEEVFEVIGSINSQVNQQVKAGNQPPATENH